MFERPALAAVLTLVVAVTLAADHAWARGRGGGHGGGKGGRAAHAGASAGGGARAAHGGTASGGGARMTARAMGSNVAGAPAGALAAQAAGASARASRTGGTRLALGAGIGGALAFGVLPRIDGRFYGVPPPRSGAALGMAAFWEVPPPNYPIPVVVVPYHPTEYIEMGPDAPVVAPPKNFWYFCPDAGVYYPYVDECPEGWELVAPPGVVPNG